MMKTFQMVVKTQDTSLSEKVRSAASPILMLHVRLLMLPLLIRSIGSELRVLSIT